MPKINIAVMFGGKSGEREVSVNSAKQVIEALDKEKYNIIPVRIEKDGKFDFNLIKDNNIDLVFPVLHGPFGEDGKLQGLLEMLGLPYLFSGVLASSLAMNKSKTKLIVIPLNIEVADEVIIEKGEVINFDEIISRLGFPIVIKPQELGSSVGMSIVKDINELKTGIKTALEYGPSAMLEKYIKGRELTVAVMGNQNPNALPIIEIIPKISDWFDYKAKYEAGGTEEICPANIPDKVKDRVQNYAIQVFKAIGCRDLARADFIWDAENDKIYFLEINTIPGMTKTSLVPQAAQKAGMEFTDFLDKLIKEALSRKY